MGTKGHPGIFSARSADDPYWRLVRKGTAPAFAPHNLRQARAVLRYVAVACLPGNAATVPLHLVSEGMACNVMQRFSAPSQAGAAP